MVYALCFLENVPKPALFEAADWNRLTIAPRVVICYVQGFQSFVELSGEL